MENKEFWISISERIARIDERTTQIQEQLRGLPDLRDRLTAVEQSSKSAHHRLDGLYKAAVLLATLASIIVNVCALLARYLLGG